MNARFKIEYFFADGDGHQRVEFAGRLIIKDELRIDHERTGNRHALFHSAGKLARVAVLDVLEAEKLELLVADAFDLLRRFQAMFGQVKPDVLADRQRVEQSARLKDHREAVFVHHARSLNGLAFNQDFAFVGCFQADDVFQQNALAAAAWSHDDENLAAIDLEIDALKDRMAGVTLAKSANLDADALLG